MLLYKRLFFSVTAIVLSFAVFILPASARSEQGWFIRRNGNLRPEITTEQSIIYKYNAYYIDKKLTDESEKKILYITFDAGYENGNTEKILDTLKEKEVPAAFFLLDNIILKNTDLVTRMQKEGHLVCNHTRNHKNLCASTKEQIEENLSSLEKIYEQATGEKMSRFFRFPEGKYNENALKYVSELGYTTVFWSFAYADWDNHHQPSPEAAIKKILSNTHNGAIILLHPTSSTNALIMPRLIDEWRAAGYSFGTLNELIAE